MRIRRQRVFRVTVQGTQEWTEEAGTRSVYEFQHNLNARFPGKAIRVQEQFLGGAKAKPVDEPEEESIE